MAENYFPSSAGIGQGGAQVLQGRTPQLSASGIVRGIEQVGKDIREEQAYQKQIELAKAKERNERLNALNETISKIQIPDNTSAAEMVVGEMWNRINKGEDYETVFQESIGNIEKIRKADNFIVQNRENLENKRYWDEESGQYMFAGDLIGNYMDGDISDIDILEEGGINAYIGSLYQKFDPLSNNWYDMASTDITKAAADFLNEKFKAKGKTTAEEVLFDSGRTGIKTVTKISPEDLDAAEQEMLASEGLKQMFLTSIGFPYRHDIEGGNKKYADFVKEALYGEKVKYSNFTSPKDGKGGVTEQDLNVAKRVKEIVNEFQDTRDASKLSEFLKPYGYSIGVNEDGTFDLLEIKYTGSGKTRKKADEILVEGLDINDADAIYRLLDDRVPDIKLKALGQVEFTDPTPQGNTQNEALPEGAVETTEEDFFGE